MNVTNVTVTGRVIIDKYVMFTSIKFKTRFSLVIGTGAARGEKV